MGLKELMGEPERQSRDRSLSSGCLFPTRKTDQMRLSVDREKQVHIHV